jgi:hypothetical protein
MKIISEVFENRIDKFTFTWGKDMKKCFHHTLKVANDPQGLAIYLKVSPSEIVIG